MGEVETPTEVANTTVDILDTPLPAKEEVVFDPKEEEAKRRKQFIEYANDILKIKKLPREFGHNTLKGLVNTQYAKFNRKQRRAELARLSKQMDTRLKTVAKQKKIVEEFQDELNETITVPSES